LLEREIPVLSVSFAQTRFSFHIVRRKKLFQPAAVAGDCRKFFRPGEQDLQDAFSQSCQNAARDIFIEVRRAGG
jgi:hypothetical protein